MVLMLTIEMVQQHWSRVQQLVAARDRHLGHILSLAEPYVMAGGKVTLLVARPSYVARLNHEASRQIIESAIETTLGESCLVQSYAPQYERWLSGPTTIVDSHHYRHRRLVEEPARRPEVLAALTALVHEAHADSHRYLKRIAGRQSLDPLGDPAYDTPLPAYPSGLPAKTLKGYLGEFMAGFIAENYAPFDIATWEVPAYLFPMHIQAFEYLERRRQSPLPERQVPGRTGDDCLAFARDTTTGAIVKALACEAKCTAGHDIDMIKDAHTKISEPVARPVSIAQLIAILQGREGDPDAAGWIAALQELLYRQSDARYERYDMIAYVCGKWPVKRKNWLPTTGSRKEYTGNRPLEAVEVHLRDVDDFVQMVYENERRHDRSA